MLVEDFHAHRALAGDDVDIIKRMHVGQVVLALQLTGMVCGIVVGITMQDDVRAQVAHGTDLDRRCIASHDDMRTYTQRPCGERHTLRMIAGGRGDDTTRARLCIESRHPVI